MTRRMGGGVHAPLQATARRSTPGSAGSAGASSAKRRRTRSTSPSPVATAPTSPRRVKIRPIRLTVDVDAAAASAADVYLRLHLLSHRLAAPRTLNLDGIFGLLANVAWTDLGPVAAGRPRRRPPRAPRRGSGARRARHRQVPADDRLRDPERRSHRRRRPGAPRRPPRRRHGRHARGFLNFNAGTLGTSMVEGRISPGCLVGDGTDVGGGVVDHGHAVGRRHRTGHDRRALPARRQLRHRHQPRRRLRRRGRPLRHRRHAREAARRRGRQGPGSCRASRA